MCSKLRIQKKRPQILYHYTDLIGFMGIVGSQTIRFSPVSRANDFHERLIHSSHKYVSFTTDGNTKGCENPMMWAHYAKMYKGICIGFMFDKLCELNHWIERKGFFIEYKNLQFMRDECPQDEMGLHYKMIEWEHEREYRLLSDSIPHLVISHDSIASVHIFKDSFSEEEIEYIMQVGLNNKIYGIRFINGIANAFSLGDNISTISHLITWVKNMPYEIAISRHDVPISKGIENANKFYSQLTEVE